MIEKLKKRGQWRRVDMSFLSVREKWLFPGVMYTTLK
jgi:hypothetical protein